MWWGLSCRPVAGAHRDRLSGRSPESAAWANGRWGGGGLGPREHSNNHARRFTTACSGVPVKKISVQRQAMLGALLGMELGGENIIPSQRAGKALAILGFTGTVARVHRSGIETVDEIEVRSVRHA